MVQVLRSIATQQLENEIMTDFSNGTLFPKSVSSPKHRILAFLSCFPVVIAICLTLLKTQHAWIAFGAVLGAGIAVVLPIHLSIFAYFVYMFLEGALKINTNYNPIAQLGGDVLLAVLMIRAFLDKSTGGVGKITRTPFIKIIFVFFIWLLLQYLNPFGLGLFPSIAGTKIYLSMMFLFFLSYHYLNQKQFENLFLLLIALASIQALLGSVEYLYGQKFVLGFHPRYKATAGNQFIGPQYRPFGTTAVPGGPAVWVFLTAPLAMYFLVKPKSSLFAMGMSCLFISLSIPLLIFCQVRTAMVIFAASIFAVASFPGPGASKRISRLFVFFLIGSVALAPQLKEMFSDEESAKPDQSKKVEEFVGKAVSAGGTKISGAQLQKLTDRIGSLGRARSFTQARQGALEAMTELSEKTIFGIGLSRVGAASAPWKDLIKDDKIFGPKWSFADNLFRAIFTELGLPGLASWLLMVLSMVGFLIKISFQRYRKLNHFMIWTCAVSVLVLLLGGWGSEGILYTPVSTFFWLFLASGIKEATDVSVQTSSI